MPFACQIVRGTTGNSGDWQRAHPEFQRQSAADQCRNCPQKTPASEAEGALCMPRLSEESEKVPPEEGRRSWVPGLVDFAPRLVELLVHVVDQV